MTEARQGPGRRSGLLLHPTSLPGPHGVGDLGPAAHAFVEFLARAGQRLWNRLFTHKLDKSAYYDEAKIFEAITAACCRKKNGRRINPD